MKSALVVALVVAATSACGGHAEHPGPNGDERCLSPAEVLAASAHVGDTTPKVGGFRLLRIYQDLVAAHRAAVGGAPAPALTSGRCLPDYVMVDVVFTGDETPIQALASEGIGASEPSPQTGLREAVTSIPTKNFVALLALPNVRSVREPDLGHVL